MKFSKIICHFFVCAFVLGQITTSVSFAFEINETKAQKVAVPYDTCKPEKGVKFTGDETTKLTTKEIENLLVGNTLMSVDRYGTFAIYYPSNKEKIGWMPKEKRKSKKEWSRGSFTVENDKYCRQWMEWKSGKYINCWEVHRGETRIDMPSFYFVCKNGIPGGDQNIVFKGNNLNIKYKGNGGDTGWLKQDEQKAKEIWKKYFGNYVNK